MHRAYVWIFVVLMGCSARLETVSIEADNEEAHAGAEDSDDSEGGGGSEGSQDAADPVDSGDDDGAVGNEEDEQQGLCPDSWVLTYSLQGRVDITDTPFNVGNSEAPVGGLDSDEIVLRLWDQDGAPALGEVLITSFRLLQDFEVRADRLPFAPSLLLETCWGQRLC